MNSRWASLAAVIAIVTASVVFSAAPSFAAGRPEPSGGQIFSLPCDGAIPNNAQLFSVDADTGDSTAIGSGNASTGGCVISAAWDPSTGKAYYQDVQNTAKWYAVNLSTGSSSPAFTTHLNGVPTSLLALAITSDGIAFGMAHKSLYRVTLSTGAMTLVGSGGALDDSIDGLSAGSILGTLYAITFDTHQLYEVDTATGTETLLATLPLGASDLVMSMQADSSGILWIDDNPGGDHLTSDLWTVDPAAFDIAASFQFSSTLETGGNDFLAPAILNVHDVAPSFGGTSATAVAGAHFVYQIPTTGLPAPTVTVEDGALPPGLVLDSTTGMISGTPTVPGTYSFELLAVNSQGRDTEGFTITVTKATVASLPTTGVDTATSTLMAGGLLLGGIALYALMLVRRRRAA